MTGLVLIYSALHSAKYLEVPTSLFEAAPRPREHIQLLSVVIRQARHSRADHARTPCQMQSSSTARLVFDNFELSICSYFTHSQTPTFIIFFNRHFYLNLNLLSTLSLWLHHHQQDRRSSMPSSKTPAPRPLQSSAVSSCILDSPWPAQSAAP